MALDNANPLVRNWFLLLHNILPRPNDEETYSSDDVEDIFRYIVNSEVLGKIGHNSVVAASLMKSVTLKVIRHCDDNRELN